jgi:hypothetical protein
MMHASGRFGILLVALALSFAACSDGGEADSGDSLSPDEIADLQYMREEEKLARDVYLVLYGEWGSQIFSNIASSEQTHTDAVANTIERLGIDDPVVDDTIGVFVDPRLTELYEDMVSEGMRSSIAALQVGATIEEVDMVDIQAAIDRAETDTIIELYESLLCGSRNHLRAFTGELENAGEPYDAQFLDPAEVDAIISSPREQCRTP